MDKPITLIPANVDDDPIIIQMAIIMIITIIIIMIIIPIQTTAQNVMKVTHGHHEHLWIYDQLIGIAKYDLQL